MLPIDLTTCTFEDNDGFRIENVISKDLFEAWIYHKDYGIKAYMFGIPKENTDFIKFSQMCAAVFEEYKRNYEEEYMD